MAGAGSAAAATGGDRLNRSDTMRAGDDIHNQAGAKLIFQSDGNLAAYRADNAVCWASNTNGRGAIRVNVNINGRGGVWVGYHQLTGTCE